jgi:hypothetical protein
MAFYVTYSKKDRSVEFWLGETKLLLSEYDRRHLGSGFEFSIIELVKRANEAGLRGEEVRPIEVSAE